MKPMKLALAACALLMASASRAEPAPPPDWMLSDQELFEVVAAETSKSTVGHERSVHAGPADHADADDPGPETLPAPERETATDRMPEAGRVSARMACRPAAPRQPATVPLRL